MSHWWRAHDEAVDDPKLILLSDKQFRWWFNLCCVCSANGGHLPKCNVIAVKLRVTADRAKRIVAELAALRLVDVDGNGDATMHNWGARQFQSDVSTSRVKRFRQRKRNVSETPPESRDREQISEAYASAPGASGELDLEVVGEDPKARLFRIGKPLLVSFGVSEKRTGSLIGQWLKAQNDPAGLLAALQFARDQNVAEPVAYVSAIMHGKLKNGAANGNDRRPGESLADFCGRLAADARELERAAGGDGTAEPFRSH